MAAKKGISPMLGKVLLPASLAVGIATTDLTDVNWSFVLGNTLAKAAIMVAVILVVKSCSSANPRKALATAGIYCMFMTRASYWSLGLPVFQAVFSKTHPEWTNLPYVAAPVDNLIILPLCFSMMLAGSLPAGQSIGRTEVVAIAKQLATTPLIVSSRRSRAHHPIWKALSYDVLAVFVQYSPVMDPRHP